MTETTNVDPMFTCPKNGCDLRGPEIPEKYRQYHGNSTHYSERVSVYDRERDRTVEYLCPKCGSRWAA